MTDELSTGPAYDTDGTETPLEIPAELPILPLRDTVLFPNSFMPLAVAREASVRLIDEATATGISNAIPRQTIACKRHIESEPVTKRGAGAAGVGYQRATGNDSPVTASCRAIVR